uniref:Palmitoyltransferase n=1 Tax=Aceria tosichella TaxID=561515 RepID=A0A6G1SPL2_9ACAR
MSCVYYLIEATKWLPVLVTCVIFAWGYFAYTFQLVIFSQQLLAQQTICLVVFNYLFISTVWSYLRTIFTPRFSIPKKFYLSPEIYADFVQAQNDQQRDEILAYVVKHNELPVYCRTYTGGYRFCEKCNLIKPDRCHHCSICRVCVLKMDHHCPWINNCVSFTNYKFFVLFLGYTFALCVFVAATTFPHFLGFWLPHPNSTYATNHTTTAHTGQELQVPKVLKADTSSPFSPQQHNNAVPFSVRFQILFLFFISGMMSFCVVFLFCYHIYLLLNNRSTLEAFRPPLMAHGPDRNAFNLGKLANLNQLFGRSKLLWFIPVYTTEGSGITFELRPQMSHDEEARNERFKFHDSRNKGDSNNITMSFNRSNTEMRTIGTGSGVPSHLGQSTGAV